MNFPRSLLAAACALGLSALSASSAELFPFVLPWDDASPSVTNLSGLLDKPAGAKGFVTARDGHLFAGEKRLRIFGVNMAFGGNFPTHADAEKVAARMAKFGINCVRFHHMDTATAPTGILQKDRRTLDSEALDRLDYFIAQLKKNGIYANLNLHVGNAYPDMPKWEGGSGYFKGVDNFFPPMIEQQRNYARALLTHVNPFTGKAYIDEPAVALIEINNENGLVMEWNGGAFENLPDPYAAELRKQWNEWLTKKYGTAAKFSAAWKEGEQPFGDEMLKNGDFSQGFGSWNLEQHEGAKAATAFEVPGEMRLKVEQPGKQSWHVQFSQSGLRVEKGKSYTVTFKAKASQPRKFTVNLSQAHEPWKVLASREVKVGKDSQFVQFTFAANESDDKARLSFSNLGSEPGDIAFEKISLRPGGIVALADGEELGKIDIFHKRDIGGRTETAQKDWHRFLFDTESRYWPEMARFIKKDLKARSLVLGTASGFSPWPVQAQLDVVDAHSYWQHPHFPHKQWDMNDWTVKNLSMAGAADCGALTALAMRRVAGKPFIVTEYNASAPNTYSSEAFLEVLALAALQDWDGVFAFAYSHRYNEWDTKRFPSFFDIDQHPTKMATLPAAVSLFYRADIKPPAKTHVVEATLETAIESVRKGGSFTDGRAYGLQREEMFLHPIAMKIGKTDKPGTLTKPEAAALRSENGELTWDTAAKRMLIATARSAGVIGNVKSGETVELGDVKIAPGATAQDWATINATVVDGAAWKSAKRILITATGTTENTDMIWTDASRTSVGTRWGKAPSLVEGIPATITLPAVKKAKAWALDGNGQRQGEVPLQVDGDRMQLSISPKQKTLWWEIATE